VDPRPPSIFEGITGLSGFRPAAASRTKNFLSPDDFHPVPIRVRSGRIICSFTGFSQVIHIGNPKHFSSLDSEPFRTKENANRQNPPNAERNFCE
jgi:hypothetical protein